MRRRLGILSLGVMLAVLLALGQARLAGPTASSSFRPAAAHATGGCWNYSCDRQDPVSYYCVYDKQTVDAVSHYDWYGNWKATQYLDWSNECAANWSEIYTDYAREVYMEADRDNGDVNIFDAYVSFGRTLMLGGLSNFVRGCSQVRQDWWSGGGWTQFKCTGWH